MTHRRCAETPQFSKVMIPRMFFSPSLRVHQGSHAVSQGDSELPGSMNSVLRLAHVPIRSAAQARQKGLLAWPRQRDNPGHKPGDGFQWQILHDRALQGDHFTHEDIIEIAATYACTRTDVCPALIVDPFAQYVLPA